MESKRKYICGIHHRESVTQLTIISARANRNCCCEYRAVCVCELPCANCDIGEYLFNLTTCRVIVHLTHLGDISLLVNLCRSCIKEIEEAIEENLEEDIKEPEDV